MMCYRDMAFCSARCKTLDCPRQFTDAEHIKAQRWWGGPDAPIGWMDFSPECPDYVEDVMEFDQPYAEPLPEYGTLMTRQEWLDDVKAGGLVDYDGYGHPVLGMQMNGDISVWPSRADELPADATHVMWFNR